jgi:hypothetical protein
MQQVNPLNVVRINANTTPALKLSSSELKVYFDRGIISKSTLIKMALIKDYGARLMFLIKDGDLIWDQETCQEFQSTWFQHSIPEIGQKKIEFSDTAIRKALIELIEQLEIKVESIQFFDQEKQPEVNQLNLDL